MHEHLRWSGHNENIVILHKIFKLVAVFKFQKLYAFTLLFHEEHSEELENNKNGLLFWHITMAQLASNHGLEWVSKVIDQVTCKAIFLRGQ